MIDLSALALPDQSHTTVEVLAPAALRVHTGACPGAAPGGDTVPGDLLRLAPGAATATLALVFGPGLPRIAAESAIGRPGMQVAVAAEHRLLAEDGEEVSLLALDAGGLALLLPLAPLARDLDYTLAGSRARSGAPPLPDRVPAAFARGTCVLLACGTPCPVERLRPGDPVLTRDAGAQPVRALPQVRVRAAGEMAPVVLSPGTIGNAGELALSPWHRLLLRQPDGREVLVQVRRLVDGDRIRAREGGFVDYFSPLLDRPALLYAEGLAVESLGLTPAVKARLPAAMRAALPAGPVSDEGLPFAEVTRIDPATLRR